MKFRLILAFILLVESESIRGFVLKEPTWEAGRPDVNRQKRTLTTICVEIKPSNPYEEPYFMCKGTDTPQPPKSSSYTDSGPQPSKPSYKPKPSVPYSESESYQSGPKGGYHAPVKTNYQPNPPPKPAYGQKPSYSDSDYSNYENTKPSYGGNQYSSYENDNSKPNVHLSVHTSSSKPVDYRPPSFSSNGPAEYSKPNSYGSPPAAYDSKPVHGGGGGYLKGFHGTSSGAYDVKYSPNPTNYEHMDQPSYSPPKAAFSGQPAPKLYQKPTYNQPSTFNKLEFQNDYTKPSKPVFNQPPAKPVYSSTPQSYRGLPEEVMMPSWDPQSQEYNSQFHSMNDPMEYYSLDTPRTMEYDHQHYYEHAPVAMDYASYDQGEPRLQATYDPYIQPAQYAPTLPTYQPVAPSAVITPSYASAAPTYTPYIPVSYSPAPISYTQPLRIQPYQQPIHLVNPACPQSYLYSLQPTLISLPCHSADPVGTSIGAPHQSYQTHINPLHEVPGGRSSISEVYKSTENNSTSVNPVDANKNKSETEKQSPIKPSEPKKTPDTTNDKPTDKKPDQAVGKERPKDDQTNAGGVTKEPDGNDTKVAYEAMIKMAKIAAQLKKDPDEE